MYNASSYQGGISFLQQAQDHGSLFYYYYIGSAESHHNKF